MKTIDKFTADGCATDDGHKVCRARGGESCAFDGALIVLQPIKDAAHVVHGPIACCGNSWEGRGTLARRAGQNAFPLTRRGFTTDMTEIDIIYGSEEKLYQGILRTAGTVKPRAVFVHATCVSGLIGEDIEAVCRRAQETLDIPVIPVNAPGFTGPKNLGNRIAGEVLLDQVIGTGETPVKTHGDINLIGEYNIAGDLWLVEPVLNRAGFRVLSRITGDATFEEITWAHQARLNVVVCGRALINVAKTMERRYGIPYVEVSFFGRTEMTRALRAIRDGLFRVNGPKDPAELAGVDGLIRAEEMNLRERLRAYEHLRGKKAVLYTGGVKSWSFISALRDLGIEVVAVGTKKSTAEDEVKMKELLGPDAPLVEDVTPKNLLMLLKDRGADMLIAGGRNQYLAVKEGYPFVDVNQERHIAYAGYVGLVNLAEQISNGLRFYGVASGAGRQGAEGPEKKKVINAKSAILIDPLKHSPAIGAAMAMQGIGNAVPLIHGAQGCGFLGKTLLTKHFREPIALATSRLFVEDVVMGSEERLRSAAQDLIDKSAPDVIAVLTSGLSEVKGDDSESAARNRGAGTGQEHSRTWIIHVATPDYAGGLELGYARTVEAIIRSARGAGHRSERDHVTVLAGSHLSPGDITELREIIGSFGLRAIVLPDLSSLDGSREGFSGLSKGGTTLAEIRSLGSSACTLAIGGSMEGAAQVLKERFAVEYLLFHGIAGLDDTDRLMRELGRISGKPVPETYQRQRRMLVDGMGDGQFYFGSKRICLALEPDHSVQMSRWLATTGAHVGLSVIPALTDAADHIIAEDVEIGGLSSITGGFDLIIANSHARELAGRTRTPLYQAGFPVFGLLGYPQKVMIGYRGTLGMINEIGSMLMRRH